MASPTEARRVNGVDPSSGCVVFCLGRKRKQKNKITRKSQEDARTIPGYSRGNPVRIFFTIDLGQKSCRTKVSRIFRIFVPNFAPKFCSEFSPTFSRTFRASFNMGDGDQKKFTKNPQCSETIRASS